MKLKAVSGIMLTLLLIGMLILTFNIQPVKASGTIYIRPDGSIEPDTANITTVDNITYTFIGNINESIVVERDNIVVDGNGYTIQGTGSGRGIELTGRSNVTIRYMEIKRFYYCIYLHSSNNNISNNTISGYHGIFLYWSSYNTIFGNIFVMNNKGIRLEYSDNNSISGNHITNSYWESICLNDSSNNTILGNNATNSNGGGVDFYRSSNNVIQGNNITNNRWRGICLWDSSNNTINGNNITNSEYGIDLHNSPNNSFRNNDVSNNKYNFGIYGYSLSHYIQDIDDSNTVNGKPVYYWVNRRDMTVPLDAGLIALIKCTRITVKNFHLTDNVLLASTTSSTITKNNLDRYAIRLGFSSNHNTISGNNGGNILLDDSSNNTISRNNKIGINLRSSSNYNTISDNNITNHIGIVLCDFVKNNTINGNNITNNDIGIVFHPSSNHNTISGNNIIANNYGVYFIASSENKFYHNNFIDNVNQVYDNSWDCPQIDPSINFWDDSYPSGGNYWSDYTGIDLNYDGIGDTSYVIDANNQDNYPLMGMFSCFPITYQEEAYDVDMICNSTISSFQFVHENRIIDFDVTGTDGTIGFCRIVIPRALIESPYTILVNGEEIPYIELPISNITHAFLYFTYSHSTYHIKIFTSPPPPPVGGEAVPINKVIAKPKLQIPWIWLTTIMLLLVTTVLYVKKRKRNTEIIS